MGSLVLINKRSWLNALGAIILLLIAALFCFEPAAQAGKFKIRKQSQPVFHSNELFPAYENYYNPKIKRLRNRYGLDQVVEGETDEFRRILLLRHWIHSRLRIDDLNPTQTRMDTFSILDAAMRGGRFHCSHASIVQHAVLNSFGYVTRRLGIGPGKTEEGPDGHHGVNEVWVNSLAKWVAVDAKYDLHFEKKGVPLSALELRDEVWRNNAEDVVPAFGLGRDPVDPRMNDPFWGFWATPQIYRWVSWEMNTNRFTAHPAAPSSTLVMFDDSIFRRNVWYRSGKPHWAYGTPYLLKIAKRDWIYWTPNAISSKVTIADNQAVIQLRSFTPNFMTYQIKIGAADWEDCGARLAFSLNEKGKRLHLRAKNLFGVTGPVHQIAIEWSRFGF